MTEQSIGALFVAGILPANMAETLVVFIPVMGASSEAGSPRANPAQ